MTASKKTALKVVETNEFGWEPIEQGRASIIGEKDIMVSYVLNEAERKNKVKKPLFSIRFGEHIMNAMKLNRDDRLVLMQDRYNIHNYLLVKAENGYKIKDSAVKGFYEMSFRYSREGLKQHGYSLVEYVINKNKTVMITLPNAESE